ncbi:unnamed protein product, partial [Rotaria socialis]
KNLIDNQLPELLNNDINTGNDKIKRTVMVTTAAQCGFFKRYRPQYPISTLVDPPLTEGHYYLASSPKSRQYPGHDDHEETLSNMDDNQMMIQNP